MRAFTRMLVALLCVAAISSAQAQSLRASEKAIAQVLGPQWKQIVGGAGTIFSGTVLSVSRAASGPQDISTIEITIRVERAIAGVSARQIVTIREWAGDWGEHPMAAGQQVLLFLYPASRLGLTSPVGGAVGQVAMQGDQVVLTQQPTGSGSLIPIRELEPAIRRVRPSGRGGR